MNLIVGIVIVAIVIWLVTRFARRSARSLPPVPTPQKAVTTPKKVENQPIIDGMQVTDVDQGALTSAGPNSWVLKPRSPLPITVEDVSKDAAEKLKFLLERATYWSEKVPQIAYLIAVSNARFKEVDEFLTDYRRFFDTKIDSAITASKDWVDASERDKTALMAEFRMQVKDEMPIYVEGVDELLSGRPTDFTMDDALLKRFSGDAELYEFYLSRLRRVDKAEVVKAEWSWWKSWEKLADMGLALRGRDIPRKAILETLKLADLNDLLRDSALKPFRRRAQAMDAALAMPDLDARLSDKIAFREQFLILAPEDLDTTTLRDCFSYASALALLVQRTYFSGRQTLEIIDEYQQDRSSYEGWKITNAEEPMPLCAAKYCREFKRMPKNLPPFHVGCTCELEPV